MLKIHKVVPFLVLMTGSLFGNLPKDVAVHVQLAPAQTVMADLGAFTQSSAMGTPLAMWGNPGMMRMMLPGALGLPQGLLDESRSAHLLVSFPEKGLPPKVGVYIPVLSEENLGDKMTGAGYQAIKGGWEKKKGRSKKAFFLPANKGLIMSENGIESAKWTQKTINAWKNTPKLDRGIKVIAKLKELMDQNEALINIMLAGMFQEIENDMAKNPEMVMLKPIIKAYQESIPLWMDQIDEAHLELNINGEGLNLSQILLAPKGSDLEKVAKNWSSDKTPIPSYANSLPLKSVSTGIASIYPNLGKDLEPLLLPMLSSITKMLGTKMDWVAFYKEATANPVTQFANATIADEKTGYPLSFSVQTLKKPQEAMAMMDKLFLGLNSINDIIPKEKGKDIMSLKFSSTKGQKKVGGQETMVYGMDMIPGKDLPPMAKTQLSKNNFRLTTLAKGDKFYTVQAAPSIDPSSQLESLLKAVQKSNHGIGNKASWKKAQSKTSKSKVIASIYLMDTLKMVAKTEADAFQGLAMTMDIGGMLNSIPDSQVPISMDLKALTRGFDFSIDLPAPAIQETVTAVMQSLMNSQGKKGSSPQ